MAWYLHIYSLLKPHCHVTTSQVPNIQDLHSWHQLCVSPSKMLNSHLPEYFNTCLCCVILLPALSHCRYMSSMLVLDLFWYLQVYFLCIQKCYKHEYDTLPFLYKHCSAINQTIRMLSKSSTYHFLKMMRQGKWYEVKKLKKCSDTARSYGVVTWEIGKILSICQSFYVCLFGFPIMWHDCTITIVVINANNKEGFWHSSELIVIRALFILT